MGETVKTVALELQPCLWQRTGIGTYTYELSRRLRNSGELRFCGNVFNFLEYKDTKEVLNGIEMPINECRTIPFGVYRRIWNVFPVSYESFFSVKADLSVFFGYVVPPRVSGRVITTVHDMTYLRYPKTMNKRNLRYLKKEMERSAARADRIITVSEFSKREILELLDIPSEKVSVIPNAATVSGTTVEFTQLSAKFSIKKPYIMFVGTIEPRKNLTRLLQAFCLLKERKGIPHQLVLVGGKGWNYESFSRALSGSAWKDSILLTGYVSAAEKNALYQNADVFVFPSLYEGFGIPPLEAMYWRCPVVASNVASLPEVCNNAAELVDPMDEECIADGIWRVVADSAYANELKRKGRIQAERYSWDNSAKRLTEICKELLET